ncbi:hypothetical protein LEMLEM_LOCUS22072 [Lemmus lemmus]
MESLSKTVEQRKRDRGYGTAQATEASHKYYLALSAGVLGHSALGITPRHLT